jgi:hypothetical protein
MIAMPMHVVLGQVEKPVGRYQVREQVGTIPGNCHIDYAGSGCRRNRQRHQEDDQEGDDPGEDEEQPASPKQQPRGVR